MKLFGKCEVIRGGQTGKQREQAVAAFQNGLTPAIVVNMKAGGAGISLHDPTGKVERSSFILPSYSVIDLVQAEGRDHRKGGARARHYLVYFETAVHTRIAERLNMKLQTATPITDADLVGQF